MGGLIRWVALSSTFAFAACQCAPPVPPPPELDIVGTGFFVGEVFIGNEPISGATVEVAGLAASALSEDGKRFALFPVPVGEHTISIHEPSGRARRFKATIAAENQTVELSQADTTLEEPVIITGRVDLGGAVSPAGTTVFVVGGTGGEVALAGDDGSFTLRNVPPGPLTIGASASQPGFDLATVVVDAVPGTQELPDAIVLRELDDPESRTTVTGNVKAAERVDHAGTLIVVDGGEEITSTNSDGDFTIDVAPGHHDFVAERPGHEPVTLPTVGTNEAGEVDGVVDMFVAPGNDDGGGAVVEGVTLAVEFPVAGQSVVVGVPVTFTADVVGAADDAQIAWTVSVLGDPGSAVALGSGEIISAVIPPAFADRQLVITASLVGSELEDFVGVVGAPLFSPNVRFGVNGDLVRRPQIAPDDDGVLRVDIAEGQPVLLVAEGVVAGTIVWTEGPTALGTDELDLGQLDEGTHLVTATLSTVDGGAGALDVRIVVAPFDFEAIVEEPTVGVTYFTDQALPLRAAFAHPWQLSFPADAVRWSDLDGNQLATGLVSSTRSAPQGAQLVQLELTDVVGNRAAVFGEYVYAPITFTASFNTPANNVTFLETAPVTFNVSFSHPTLDAADAIVTLSSSVQGLLANDDGETQFAPNTDVVIQSLQPGPHQITARVLGEGRVASVTQTLTVDADFVTANLQVPPSVLALDGASMRFTVVTGATPGLTPRVTWLLDGAPFEDDWDIAGDYVAANPAAPGNPTVDLGTYQTGALTPAFLDARFGPGVHTVQAWVRLPNDPAAEASGCVNNGSISRCLSFSLTVFDTLTQKAAAADVTLTAGQVETWQGGILLKGSYTIDGGTLIIQPGTTVVVDMANRNTPTVQDAAAQRFIQVNDGSLQVGAPGGVPPVRFEVRQAFVPQNRWQGIRTASQTAGVARSITVQNVVIGDANDALQTNTGTSVRAALNNLVLEDVTVERSLSGVIISCPTSFARMTFRDGSGGVTLFDDALCPTEWGIDGAVFERVGTSISYNSARAQRLTFTNLTFSASPAGTDMNLTGPLDVVISDSSFATNTGTAIRYSGNGAEGALRVERNEFVDVATGIVHVPSTQRRIDIVDNTFTNNTTAVQLFGVLGDDINVHLNRFLDNTSDITIVVAAVPDIDAQGNFFGDPNDTSTAAGRMAAVPGGTVAQLPTIVDAIDNLNVSRVRVDNFLETAEPPLAFIKAPEHMASYHPDLCIPLVANAPRSDVDIDPISDCTWSLFGLGGDPNDPSQGTPLTPSGADGCVLEDIADGDHGLALTCIDPDSGASTTHTTRLRVSSSTYAGRVTAPGLTLTGDILVDGDLIVDPDATLTIAPGSTLRMASSDRAKHAEPRIVGSGRIGDRDSVDLFVRGTLHIAGTAAQPVTLRADTGEASALWGSIVADVDATVIVEHANIASADALFDGQQAAEEFAAPSISLTNSTVSSVVGIARGTCPAVIADTSVVFVNGDVLSCVAAGDVSIARSDFDDVRAFGNAVELTAYAGTVPTVFIEDSTFTGNVNLSPAFTTFVGNINFTRSVVDGWATSFSMAGTGQLTVIDSTARNFTTTAFALASSNVTQVDRSTFDGGGTLAAATIGIFVMRDSLVTDVTTLFTALQLGQVVSFAFTGNEVRDASTVFDVNAFNGQVGIAAWTLTGNNFIGTTANVVDVRGNTITMVTRIDLDGSFFGAGNDTIAEIQALIVDPRTDAAPGDTIEGNTDFTGFATSPLTLDLP